MPSFDKRMPTRWLVAVGWILCSAQTFAQSCQTLGHLQEKDITSTVAIVRNAPMDGGSVFKSSRGIGFFVSEPVKQVHSGGSHVWFVTSRHLLREQHFDGSAGRYLRDVIIERFFPDSTAKARVSSAVLPVRGSDGRLLWLAPTDESIDVAVLPVELTGPWSAITCVNVQQFVTTSLLQRERVGDSDDVVFLTAFASGIERQSQRILVQHGHLVDFARKLVRIDSSGTDSRSARPYLGRVTSFGTNAGAPVFLKLALFEKGNEGKYHAFYSFYLAGALESYLRETEDPDRYIADDYAVPSASGSTLVAIAPAEEILKLIDLAPGNVNVVHIGDVPKK